METAVEVRTVEERAAEVRAAEVRTAEVRTAEVQTAAVRFGAEPGEEPRNGLQHTTKPGPFQPRSQNGSPFDFTVRDFACLFRSHRIE